MYRGIRGASTVMAASIGQFNDYGGDVARAVSTAGDLGSLSVKSGNLGDLFVVGSAGKIAVSGDIVGNILVTGDLGSLSFDNVYGIADSRVISVGGHVGSLSANVISGGQTDGGMLVIAAGNGVDGLTANRVTGGADSQLIVAVQAGLGTMCVGTLDGGAAAAGSSSQTVLAINGDLGKLVAGQILGGSGLGQAHLLVSIDAYTDAAGNVQAGDLKYLKADLVAGGDADSAGSSASFFVTHDLLTACIGTLIGTTPTTGCDNGCDQGHDTSLRLGLRLGLPLGRHPLRMRRIHRLQRIQWFSGWSECSGGCGGSCSHGQTHQTSCGDPAVVFTVGHDIVNFSAGEINGGLAAGAGALAYVRMDAGHDIVQFNADKIVGGTSTGGGIAYVDILAEHDIINMIVGTVLGSTTGTISDGGSCGGGCGDHTGSCGGGCGDHSGSCGSGCGDHAGSCGADVATTPARAAADAATTPARAAAGAATTPARAAADAATTPARAARCGDHSGSCGGGCVKGDPAVQIHAFNDIQNFTASKMVAGWDGEVYLLAGLQPGGVVSGETDAQGVFQAGSLGNIKINTIDADDGVIAIAASGDIVKLQACSIDSGQVGRVNVVAGGSMTVNVGASRRGWTAMPPAA